ncbi:MAG: hypothetical protein ACOC40_01895 [Thermoplasmatota archaeon]
MGKKKIIIIGIITLICISAVSIYAYTQDDDERNTTELYYGDLIRTSVNNTTDSATFKVVMNKSTATRDGEYSPLGENNSYLEATVRNKTDDEIHYNSNINWTYIDSDNSSTVTTGDKVIVYNRSRYVGIKTQFAIEIYMGSLSRKSDSVGTGFLTKGI